MADSKLADLPAASSVAPTDILYAAVDPAGTPLDRKVTVAVLTAGLAQKSANLSDLASASTARTNLGLAAIAASGSASDLSSGTVATARLGSGSASSSTFLRGDGTWATMPSEALSTVAASGTATTFNIANNGVGDITLTGNCTLTISGSSAGTPFSCTLILRQDATGSRTVSWPSGTKWAGGTPPTLSTSANAIDVVTLLTVDGGTVWLAFLGGKAFA